MAPRFRVTTGQARKLRGLNKQGGEKQARAGKYNARGMWLDKLTGLPAEKGVANAQFFASAAEAVRFGQLLTLRNAGVIGRLETQVNMRCMVNGQLVCDYRADFRYEVMDERGRCQYVVVEDVKGMLTDAYVLKKKLVEACHGIDVNEIPAAKVKQWAGRHP